MMKALFCHILFLLFMLPMWSQSNIIENYIHISKKKAYPIIIYRLFMMIAMEQSGSVLSMGWMFMTVRN